MSSQKSEWYFIVNPHAGSGKTMTEWSKAESRLKELGVSFKAVLTNRRFHATELAYEAAAVGYRRLVAVGGDGSVHEVLKGIMLYADESGADTSEFYVAVIPIGSGNDWIKATGVPHDTSEVVELLHLEHFMKSDLVRVESEHALCYMANVGGVGFDSRVCDRVNFLKNRGHRSRTIYLKALLRTIMNLKTVTVEVKCDGGVGFSGPAYSIALGNGKYSGGGMIQVPDALMDDGLLDVMVVPKLPLHRMLVELPKLLNGTIGSSEYVRFFRCRDLQVRQLDVQSMVRDPELVEVDGEIEGTLPLHVSMTGKQINVLSGID